VRHNSLDKVLLIHERCESWKVVAQAQLIKAPT